MKEVKIGLVVIVLGVIGFFIWKWSVGDGSEIGDGSASVEQTNRFIKKIQEETDSLRTLSIQEFSRDTFKKIQGELDYFHKNGNLGDNAIQNDQEYKNLSKTLFAAYVPRLYDEACYKLRQSNWKSSDLNIIRGEINEIESNTFFDNASSFVSKFDSIQDIISKYYEIDAFIKECQNYPSNLEYSVDDRFPIDQVVERIDQSKVYLSSSPGFGYIDNVTSLRNALMKIPSQMYLKNFEFLKLQIQQNSGKYDKSSLESQADYSKEVYQPLNNSLDEFDNELYGVDYNPVFSNDYTQLKGMLNDDNDKASAYYQKKWDEQLKNQIEPK
jgi:hypothetical protein